jgi:hypothetical protein
MTPWNFVPLHRRDLHWWLAAELPGGFTVEFRAKSDWDAAMPTSTVLIHSFVADSGPSYLGHSYLEKDDSTGADLSASGDFFLGPRCRRRNDEMAEGFRQRGRRQ